MTQDPFAQLFLNGRKQFEQARINMLKQQLRTWDVLDETILSLFYHIPREDFVPPKFKALAFADMSIPLGHGQAMMFPKEEARILQELHIHKEEKILLLGAESGYLITLLSKLGKYVHYIDNDLAAFDAIKHKLAVHQVDNATLSMGNLYQGWQDNQPFNVILLTGSLPAIPDYLKNALAIKGRLFIVVGNPPAMEATLITRLSENTWREHTLFETIRPRMTDFKEPDTFVF